MKNEIEPKYLVFVTCSTEQSAEELKEYIHMKTGWTFRVRRLFGFNSSEIFEEQETKDPSIR